MLHMLSCLRLGYQDPVGDAAEYLKLVQFPLWTLSFVTFFRQRRNLDYRVVGLLAVNVGLILLVIALSYAVGQPVYTYDYPERGVAIGILGWFGVANSQSSILTLLVPPLLLWGLRSQRLWQFCLCCLGGFGLLYFTGTRLTYYGAILIGCAFLALLLLRLQPGCSSSTLRSPKSPSSCSGCSSNIGRSSSGKRRRNSGRRRSSEASPTSL